MNAFQFLFASRLALFGGSVLLSIDGFASNALYWACGWLGVATYCGIALHEMIRGLESEEKTDA